MERALAFGRAMAFVGGLAAGALAGAAGAWALADARTSAGEPVAARSRRTAPPPRAAVRGEPRETSQDEPEFEEAISLEEFRRRTASSAPEVTVEEIRDADDGMTASERLERFKREHPADFKALEESRARRAAARREERRVRREFIATIDQTLLTEDERKAHEAYAAALAERDACREAIETARAGGASADAATLENLSRAERALRTGAAGERRALLSAMARAVGVAEGEIGAFTEAVGKIFETTETGWRAHRRGIR